MIPLGDIDLRQELLIDYDTGIVNRNRERPRVRRLYTAKIAGQKSEMTVAVYQGDGAQEVCILYILDIYSEFRRNGKKMSTDMPYFGEKFKEYAAKRFMKICF
jgi:hypothetical protein